MALLTGRGVECWHVGDIVEGTGQVHMLGEHTRG
jgi:phosphoribosylformylglycinamidine cyclo-ligase